MGFQTHSVAEVRLAALKYLYKMGCIHRFRLLESCVDILPSSL